MYIQIFTLYRNSENDRSASPPFRQESCQTISTSSNVCRVAWNLTGTVLSTSSEDGSLELWRRDFAGNWISVQSIPRQHGDEIKNIYN